MGQKTFNAIVIGLLAVLAIVLAATAYFAGLRGAASTGEGEGEEAIIVTQPPVVEEASHRAASRGATPEGEPTNAAGALPPETGPAGTAESKPEEQATPLTTAVPGEAGRVSLRDPASLSIGLEGIASGLRTPVGMTAAGGCSC